MERPKSKEIRTNNDGDEDEDVALSVQTYRNVTSIVCDSAGLDVETNAVVGVEPVFALEILGLLLDEEDCSA